MDSIKLASIKDISDVFKVILLSDGSLLSSINLMKNTTNEGILSAEQPKGLSKLLIIDNVSALWNVPKSISDLIFLIFSYEKICLFLTMFWYLIFWLEQFHKFFVQYFRLFFLVVKPTFFIKILVWH